MDGPTPAPAAAASKGKIKRRAKRAAQKAEQKEAAKRVGPDTHFQLTPEGGGDIKFDHSYDMKLVGFDVLHEGMNFFHIYLLLQGLSPTMSVSTNLMKVAEKKLPEADKVHDDFMEEKEKADEAKKARKCAEKCGK